MTYGMSLSCNTSTTTDTTCWNEVALIVATYQLGNLVLIVGKVVVNGPVPILSLNRLSTDGNLDTLILHRSDVSHHGVLEVRTSSYVSAVQQVGSLTQISIDAESDSLIQNAEVQTDVISISCLPLQ